MTDVSLPLCACQLNKLLQQQHVPTAVTVQMEGPPVRGGHSSVTLAHTAILKEFSIGRAQRDPLHHGTMCISGMREGGRTTLGEKYDNGVLN